MRKVASKREGRSRYIFLVFFNGSDMVVLVIGAGLFTLLVGLG